jgi:hypothetical protein
LSKACFGNHCKLVHECFINSWKAWYCFEVFKMVIVYYQLQIFIDASVGINILILKYKGEGEEGCSFLKTFIMQIKESSTDFY